MASIELWRVAPEKKQGLEDFFNRLENLSPSQGYFAVHPVFSDEIVKGVEVPTLIQDLNFYYKPVVLSQLALTIGQDVDVDRDLEIIDLMKDVRQSCFGLIYSVTTQPRVTPENVIQLYTYICKFHVVFHHPQYGARKKLYKNIITKGLSVLHSHGVTPLFLILCELCPNLFSKDCYPVIQYPGSRKIRLYEQYIEEDWFLQNLMGKHRDLWNSCVQSQFM